MTTSDLATFKRVIQNLKLDTKTHLSRQDVDRISHELEMSREYKLADYIRSLDPASLSALLR